MWRQWWFWPFLRWCATSYNLRCFVDTKHLWIIYLFYRLVNLHRINQMFCVWMVENEDIGWQLDSAELIFIWMHILLSAWDLRGIVIGCLKLETKPDAIKTKKIYFIFVVSFTGINERHDGFFVHYWLAVEWLKANDVQLQLPSHVNPHIPVTCKGCI